jgi:hypothetical protein
MGLYNDLIGNLYQVKEAILFLFLLQTDSNFNVLSSLSSKAILFLFLHQTDSNFNVLSSLSIFASQIATRVRILCRTCALHEIDSRPPGPARAWLQHRDIIVYISMVTASAGPWTISCPAENAADLLNSRPVRG